MLQVARLHKHCGVMLNADNMLRWSIIGSEHSSLDMVFDPCWSVLLNSREGLMSMNSWPIVPWRERTDVGRFDILSSVSSRGDREQVSDLHGTLSGTSLHKTSSSNISRSNGDPQQTNKFEAHSRGAHRAAPAQDRFWRRQLAALVASLLIRLIAQTHAPMIQGSIAKFQARLVRLVAGAVLMSPCSHPRRTPNCARVPP
jgi:hypothetical protein